MTYFIKYIKIDIKLLRLISASILTSFLIFSFLAYPISGFAVSSGDVIINEFSSASDPEWVELLNTTGSPISLEGWTIQDAVNPPKSLSDLGTIPANGLVVFEQPAGWLNNDPATETITIFDETNTAIHSVSYGSDAELSITAPADGESAIFVSLPSTWAISSTPSKGWFNDAGQDGKAPLLSGDDSIESFLTLAGINSNIGELDNPSATPATEDEGALYFEKESKGKIVFEKSLNLSDRATVAVLQSLGEAMEMSEGHIAFDSETATAMSVTGAKVYMYELDELGISSKPSIIVKDDNDTTIDGTDIIEDVSYDAETGTLVFNAAHFTQFDIDDNVYVDDSSESEVQDGTEANPFLTIEEGINAVPNGGTVHVAFGTYNENLDISKSLTLLGDVGDTSAGPAEGAPIIRDSSDCESRILSIEANDITVKGFVLDGNGCSRPVVRIGEEVSNTEISDNEIENGRKGVDLSPYSDDNTVTNNIIHDNDREGVWIGGSTNNTISDNEIYGNATGIGLGEGGDGESGDVSGNEITGNHIYDNEDSDSGIHVDGGDVNFTTLTISNNNIASNGSYGIYFNEISDGTLTISDNEINENGSNGLYIGDIYDSTILIDGNIIDNNAEAGIYIGDLEEGRGEGITSLSITNNTISDNSDLDERLTGVHINWIDGSAGVKINFNAITGNGNGLVVDGIAEGRDDIDANNNWWGTRTGPTHESNIDGTGDEVSDRVDYAPWLATLNLTSNNPIKAQIINSAGEAVGGGVGLETSFTAEGVNPKDPATEDIISSDDDNDNSASYNVDARNPNVGDTTVEGTVLFARIPSTLIGTLVINKSAPVVPPPSNSGGGGGGNGPVVGSFGGGGSVLGSFVTIVPTGAQGQVLGSSITNHIEALKEQIDALRKQIDALIQEQFGGGLVAGSSKFIFTINLKQGMKINDVTELQNRLTSEGVYTGPITGYFGPLTFAGAKKYQILHGIISTGFVGPLTRAELNK